MSFKTVVAFVSVILLSFLMIFYFFPFNTSNFKVKSGNYNFGDLKNNGTMQFYPNMRFQNTGISYRISECPLQKQNDMEYAFTVVENLTPLLFYPVNSNEEIFITCQDIAIIRDGSFIAGEGGPGNITVAGEFNVITSGDILLITESACPKPNIAIHELFHVLGFNHSSNQEDIMYPVTNCDQTIGQDLIDEINRLYSIESKPDLVFQNVSAMMSGRFLDLNMTVINAGLKEAGESTVTIYANGNVIKEVDLIPLPIGVGRIITMQKIFVPQMNVKEFELDINDNFGEISKDNNKIKLEIK